LPVSLETTVRVMHILPIRGIENVTFSNMGHLFLTKILQKHMSKSEKSRQALTAQQCMLNPKKKVAQNSFDLFLLNKASINPLQVDTKIKLSLL